MIEATSGNTGIGLAMVCAQKGYPLVVVMARELQRRAPQDDALPRREGRAHAGRGEGHRHARQGGRARARRTAGFWCRQFENEANADMHSRTTALEILEDFAGERLDYWVTGYGTGGTLKGVARVLQERSARDEDRRVRARQLADARERHPAGAAADGSRRAAIRCSART